MTLLSLKITNFSSFVYSLALVELCHLLLVHLVHQLDPGIRKCQYISPKITALTSTKSMIGVGLNWWQAIIVIFVSQFISSIAMAFNSRSAAVYHIGFPCVSRSVFGMWGSYYFVGARAILAIIWYAVQSKLFYPASSEDHG